MESSTHQGIVLKKLCLNNADKFFKLHQHPIILGQYVKDLDMYGETPIGFTKRLLWLSKGIYTIRLSSAPETIIGSSLIYKANNEFHYGGTLLPDYRGKGILLKAFEQSIELAKYCYGIPSIKVFLNTATNHFASVMYRLGFTESYNKDKRIFSKSLLGGKYSAGKNQFA